MTWALEIYPAQNDTVDIKIHFDANHNGNTDIVERYINKFCKENGFIIENITYSERFTFLYFRIKFVNIIYAELFSLHSNMKRNKNFRSKIMKKLNHKNNYNYGDDYAV